jgi:hypothetical protein
MGGLVQTPNALASSWVTEEVDAAINLKHNGRLKGVIPIIAAACAPGSVPPIWDALHRYDATSNYDQATAGLFRAIGLNETASQTQTTQPGPIPVPQAEKVIFATRASKLNNHKSPTYGAYGGMLTVTTHTIRFQPVSVFQKDLPEIRWPREEIALVETPAVLVRSSLLLTTKSGDKIKFIITKDLDKVVAALSSP